MCTYNSTLFSLNKLRLLNSRVGNSLMGSLSESLIFCEKMSKRAICSKNGRFDHSLIFGEQPERFAHPSSFMMSHLSESLTLAYFWRATWTICSHRSILVSDLSDLLKSLYKKREWANWSFCKKLTKKTYKNVPKIRF